MSSVAFGCRSAAMRARLVAMVVVPTPPLGLNTATIAPAVRVADRRRRRPRRPSLRRWKRSDSASTRASSSAWSNGFVMTSSAPASSRRDPLLEVVGLGDREHRHRGRRLSRRSSAMTAATVDGGGTWSMMTRL